MSNARNSSNRRKLSDKNVTKGYRYEDEKVHNGSNYQAVPQSLVNHNRLL